MSSRTERGHSCPQSPVPPAKLLITDAEAWPFKERFFAIYFSN